MIHGQPGSHSTVSRVALGPKMRPSGVPLSARLASSSCWIRCTISWDIPPGAGLCFFKGPATTSQAQGRSRRSDPAPAS